MDDVNTFGRAWSICTCMFIAIFAACNDDASTRDVPDRGGDATSSEVDVEAIHDGTTDRPRDVTRTDRDTRSLDGREKDGQTSSGRDGGTEAREDASDVAPTDTNPIDGESRDTESRDVERRDTSMSPDGRGTSDGGPSDTADTGDATSSNDGGRRDSSSRDTTADTSPKSCSSPGAKTCTSDEWCDFPGNSCGEADSGTCRQRPQACPNGGEPVCGCDDQTYANECIAHSKGVDIQYKGQCRPQSGTCDGQTCSKKEYCAYPKGTCGQNASGTCELKPTGCPTTYDPVCGCDGQTYSNKCKARANGVNVESDGTCQPKPGACGGQTCSKKEYCAYPKGTCGRGASGTCKSKPSGFCPGVYKPVCGCDGKTYQNKCRARSNGVSIKSNGKC